MSGNKKEEALIHVQGLGKSFGAVDVLKDISVDINKGDVVFVIGPSGSGKSTFLRCLNRLEEPTRGHIFFEGTDITDPKTNIDKHRQKMGMVFQHFNVFNNLTVGKNVTLAFLASTIGTEALVISLLAVAKGIAKVFRHGFTSPLFLSLDNPANSISS